MKVAYYTNLPSPYRVSFFNLLGELFQLSVVFECKKAKDRNDGFESNDFLSFNPFFLKGFQYKEDASYCPGITRWYKKNKPDINVVCNYSSLTGIKLINYFIRKKIPYIIEGDGAFNTKDKGIKRALKTKIFKNAYKIIFTSDEHARYFISHGASKEKLWKSPFSSVRNSDILNNSQTLIDKIEKHDKQQKVFLTISRFIKLKNIETIIKAYGIVAKDASLVVVGGNPTKEYLDIVNDYHLKNVSFVPFVQKNELFDIIDNADCFVFASKQDVWGLVINETMARGLPIIAGNGALAAVEMSKNNKGIKLVDSNNVKEYATAMSTFLSLSKEDKIEMSLSNISMVKNFTLESMVENRKNLFETIFKELGYENIGN